VTSKCDKDDATLGVFRNIVAPADTGRRFPDLIPAVVMPPECCSTFRRLDKLSAAVGALRKLLGPVLVLFMDRGRSRRLIRTAGRLRSFSSPLAPLERVDEVAESGDKLRERLRAAINLKEVGECSEESGFTGVWGREDSVLVDKCPTNGTSEIVRFWGSWTVGLEYTLGGLPFSAYCAYSKS
jgi:hypothetical protein